MKTLNIKLKTLVSSTDALNYLSSQKFNARAAFRIGTNMKHLAQHFENYDKARRELVDSYSEEDPNNSERRIIPEDKRLEYEKEVRDLLEEKITLPVSVIDIETSLNREKLSPANLYPLFGWMLTIKKSPENSISWKLQNSDVLKAYTSLRALGSHEFRIEYAVSMMKTLRAMQSIIEKHQDSMMNLQINKAPKEEVDQFHNEWLESASELTICKIPFSEVEDQELDSSIFYNLPFMFRDLPEDDEQEYEDEDEDENEDVAEKASVKSE